MEAIKNLKMVEAARFEAKEMLKKNPSLNKFPLIQEKLSNKHAIGHFSSKNLTNNLYYVNLIKDSET
jgi:hypothetical protein